ncbi:MAG: acyltransferase [Bacteroidota bacterium]
MRVNERLRELDFLRGIAILLVLLRHANLFSFTTHIGWIGVDLFFVLSGFLVSGLLFKEYLKFGNISPGRFLIRRGFKIYPVYFLFYPIYLVPLIASHELKVAPMLADLTFVQNYVNGWGYAYGPSWSLAVEEHFYIGIALVFWFLMKKKLFNIKMEAMDAGVSRFEKIIFILALTVLLLRLSSNVLMPHCGVKNFTMTHLRIDSLLGGVLIAYLYYFRTQYFKDLFLKFKNYGLLISFLLIAVTVLGGNSDSLFVKTLGFSLLYISFSFFLAYVLLTENINQQLNGIFSKHLVTIVSKIGLYSYSIYVIHTAVNNYIHTRKAELLISQFTNLIPVSQYYFVAILSLLLSILAGMVMTKFVENFFLNLRNRYFPARIA